MRVVSVSSELITIQRAVDGAALLVEVGRQGGVEDEDCAALVSAVLALASCRLRDLGRAARGTLDLNSFWAPHSAANEVPGEMEIVLRPVTPGHQARRARRRG